MELESHAMMMLRSYSSATRRKRPREKDIGNELKLEIPDGIVVEYKYPNLQVAGPLGVKETNLEIFEHLGIRLTEDGKSLAFTSYTPGTSYTFARGPKWRSQKVYHRLNQVARLVERDFEGVTSGYRKDLELRGLGFKWALQTEGNEDVLTMNIGFSHEVRYAFPKAVKCTVMNTTELFLESCCKDTLGRTAKDLIKLPRRDVYKGKGIFEKGFTPRLKEAKRK
ncbi:ribosomal protein L6 [Chloropicon primus]|nr:ribosomal protein L6 [Chloropicon primus]